METPPDFPQGPSPKLLLGGLPPAVTPKTTADDPRELQAEIRGARTPRRTATGDGALGRQKYLLSPLASPYFIFDWMCEFGLYFSALMIFRFSSGTYYFYSASSA